MKKLTYTDLIAQLGISSAHPGGIALTKSILKREDLSASTKVLDLGCGTGQTSSFIKTNYDSDVAAIDSHPEMIEKAHNRFYSEKQKINLVQSNAENLPFASNTFDFIIVESVLAFTTQEKTVKEIARVLKENGVLIAIEMTQEDFLDDNEQKEIEQLYDVKLLTEKQWNRIFDKQGFTNISVYNKSEFLVNEPTPPTKNQPSQNIDPEIFNLLQQHSKLLLKYKEKLGYRIYRCVK